MLQYTVLQSWARTTVWIGDNVASYSPVSYLVYHLWMLQAVAPSKISPRPWWLVPRLQLAAIIPCLLYEIFTSLSLQSSPFPSSLSHLSFALVNSPHWTYKSPKHSADSSSGDQRICRLHFQHHHSLVDAPFSYIQNFGMEWLAFINQISANFRYL